MMAGVVLGVLVSLSGLARMGGVRVCSGWADRRRGRRWVELGSVGQVVLGERLAAVGRVGLLRKAVGVCWPNNSVEPTALSRRLAR